MTPMKWQNHQATMSTNDENLITRHKDRLVKEKNATQSLAPEKCDISKMTHIVTSTGIVIPTKQQNTPNNNTNIQ
ncbi:23054_t:CDS:2 [Gigaspora margarita]|uniref:23054_t:CDS:1 n=1 Tax=Gigaspora margarita TaxID=4874 RepID=A0ABN7V0E2_GIGMA|nr:23054_t:CDS:2 [Gigaspora margarita]